MAVKVEKSLETFEDILDKLGGFGKFQIYVLILILALEIPGAFMGFIAVFTGSVPKIWFCGNETIPYSEVCNCNSTLYAPPTSIVAEWNLVCESSWVSDFTTTLQMAGMGLGNLFAAQISDWYFLNKPNHFKYGRKKSYLSSVFMMTLGNCVSASAISPYMYAAGRFLSGFGFSGFFSTTTIYPIEFMPIKWRTIPAALSPFGIAIIMMGPLAYLFSNWRNLIWVTTAPFALIIVIFPLLPESPRFLLRQGNVKEAHKVFTIMSKMNKKDSISLASVEYIASKETKNEDGKAAKLTVFHLMKEKTLRRTTICLMLIWASWAICFFGISFNVKNLKGDPYLNVVYMGIAESLGYPSTLMVINRIGRRKTSVSFMSLSAGFLIILSILKLTIEDDSFPLLILFLYLMGKFGTSGARVANRLLTGESFPTGVRMTGIGACGVAACLAGVLAPQIAYLGLRWPSAPFFAFALLSVVGSLFAFCLRETSGLILQETTNSSNSPDADRKDTEEVNKQIQPTFIISESDENNFTRL